MNTEVQALWTFVRNENDERGGRFTFSRLVCCFCMYLQDALDKDLNPDGDEYTAPKDGGLPAEPGACLLPDGKTAGADGKRNAADDDGCQAGHRGAVFRDRKAYGEGVDGSGDPLQDQVPAGQDVRGSLFFGLLPFGFRFEYHLRADIEQQDEGNPRYYFFK